MAVKSKEEIMNSIKERLGDDTTDEALSFLEDIKDTFDDLETKSSNQTNWEQKYKDNDAEWRKKYKERFFNSDNNDDNNGANNNHFEDEEDEAPKTFEDLFTKEN